MAKGKKVKKEKYERCENIHISSIVALTLGRKPTTESERILAFQIEEIKRKGRIVEIPNEWP